jgi:Late exocytosis, associated with Golgi transport
VDNFNKKYQELFKTSFVDFESLDGTKKDRCTKCKNFFKWYTLLRDLGDEELRSICGTDAALYLVFERFAAYFFAIVTGINLLVFIPLYLTGHRDDRSMESENKDKKVLIKFISALAIMGESDKDKRLAMFILMMFIFTLLTFILMYNYR